MLDLIYICRLDFLTRKTTREACHGKPLSLLSQATSWFFARGSAPPKASQPLRVAPDEVRMPQLDRSRAP